MNTLILLLVLIAVGFFPRQAIGLATGGKIRDAHKDIN